LKLRGVGQRSTWSLAAGQAIVPISVGGLVGLVVGGLGARWWAGPVASGQLLWLDLAATAGAAVVAVLIAVLAAVGAERRLLAESVAELGRRIPARRRGWQAGVVDLVLIALAVAAAYELRSSTVASSPVRGLDVLAPTLIALAVGVAAARAVPWLATV